MTTLRGAQQGKGSTYPRNSANDTLDLVHAKRGETMEQEMTLVDNPKIGSSEAGCREAAHNPYGLYLGDGCAGREVG